MGGIKISYNTVREKADRLKVQIRDVLDGSILIGYGKIEEAVSQSSGAAAEAALENIRQEREALTELKGVMIKILKLLENATDAFEEADQDYCVSLENKEE